MTHYGYFACRNGHCCKSGLFQQLEMKMKKLKLIGLILGLSFAGASSAQSYEFVAADNKVETQFCVHAGNNNASKMKSLLRQMDIRKRKANINAIQCNDISAAKFAYKYGAADTFNYLNTLSFGRNKVRTSVSIRDVAKLNKDKDLKPIVVEVSSGI
tara:strand:+ start:798 stop:1268 length:471 start_codon:yes stop_codon:yes gene_type:complete